METESIRRIIYIHAENKLKEKLNIEVATEMCDSR